MRKTTSLTLIIFMFAGAISVLGFILAIYILLLSMGGV